MRTTIKDIANYTGFSVTTISLVLNNKANKIPQSTKDTIMEAVEKAGLAMEEIDLFILHQANIRIIESVAKRLKVPMEKFPTNLERCGNISAGSVPVLLDDANQKGMLKRGDRVVLAGFGAGLTWGASVMTW